MLDRCCAPPFQNRNSSATLVRHESRCPAPGLDPFRQWRRQPRARRTRAGWQPDTSDNPAVARLRRVEFVLVTANIGEDWAQGGKPEGHNGCAAPKGRTAGFALIGRELCDLLRRQSGGAAASLS